MSAFDECMAKLDEIDHRLACISGEIAVARETAVTQEFIWFWMFCVPAGGLIAAMLLIAVLA